MVLCDGPGPSGYIVCDPSPNHGVQVARLASEPAAALVYNGVIRNVYELWTTKPEVDWG